MRYATAIGHLQLVAEACAQWASRPALGDEPGSYLVAAYAFGDILDMPDDADATDVVFVVDEGLDTLPWGIEPPAVRAFVNLARIDRHPIRWFVQPRDIPIGHRRVARPVRLWDADQGIDEVALEALRQRRAEDVRLPAPDAEESRTALERHLVATRAALDVAIERFWDADWRSERKGAGRYPEHTLWELAWGVRDLERALEANADRGR